MSAYVQLKGTRAGVLMAVSEECPFATAIDQMGQVLAEHAGWLASNPVSVDLGWREVREDDLDALVAALATQGCALAGVISTSLATRRLFEARGYKAIIGALGLARHGGRAKAKGGVAEVEAAEPAVEAVEAVEELPAPDPYAGGEPTLVLRKNLRSGQRVTYPGNVVVFGDVNHGAEIEAGGDVIVLGSVRGTVHAGSEGSESARIVAINLHAPQVRIGEHRALVESKKQHQGNQVVMSQMQAGALFTSLLGGS